MADKELKDLVTRLSANEKLTELVKMMNPKDITVVIAKDLGLVDVDAKFVTTNLLQNAFYSGPNIETNKKYPVPAALKDNTVDEDFINNLGALTPTVDKNQFPPDPIGEPNEWPFDGVTVSVMNPKNKGIKKGLTENPLQTNVDLRQPGISGKGTPNMNTPHNRYGSTRGWSSSPANKEYDLPEESNSKELPGNEIDKEVPVGAPVPTFFGGRNPGRMLGFRRR